MRNTLARDRWGSNLTPLSGVFGMQRKNGEIGASDVAGSISLRPKFWRLSL
jgi:hypothetical protein